MSRNRGLLNVSGSEAMGLVFKDSMRPKDSPKLRAGPHTISQKPLSMYPFPRSLPS